MSFTFSKKLSLAKKFNRFHEKNPHVYAKLVDIAIELKKFKSKRRYGVAAIFERLRWVSMAEGDEERFHLNNSYRAFYARMLAQEPGLEHMFETRKSVADQSKELTHADHQ